MGANLPHASRPVDVDCVFAFARIDSIGLHSFSGENFWTKNANADIPIRSSGVRVSHPAAVTMHRVSRK